MMKLNVLSTLSGLLLNIKSICVCEDEVILVGPSVICVKSKLSVICLRAFLLV